MSLRVRYRISCDRCEAQVLEHEMCIPAGVDAPPRLTDIGQVAGMDLCAACAQLVRDALSRAMDRRSAA